MIHIDDPDDPRLEPYRAVRERDLKGREGLFIAESALVVRRLLSNVSLYRAASVLVSSSQAEAKPDLLTVAAARGVPVYVADQPVMDRVAGFAVHRGVLAAGMRGDPRDPAELLAAQSDQTGPLLVAVLIGVSNHDNIGAVIRCAAAFGARAVLLDETSSDPLYRKAIRVSAGHALSMPTSHGGSADAILAALEQAGVTPFAFSPGASEDVRGLTPPARAALVLGAEGPGLPASVLAQCRSVRIAIAPGVDSLNVAVAAGIALFALSLN